MPLQAEFMPAPHAGAPRLPDPAGAGTLCGASRRLSMTPGFARSGRRIEYGMSIRRPPAITSAMTRATIPAGGRPGGGSGDDGRR